MILHFSQRGLIDARTFIKLPCIRQKGANYIVSKRFPLPHSLYEIVLHHLEIAVAIHLVQHTLAAVVVNHGGGLLEVNTQAMPRRFRRVIAPLIEIPAAPVTTSFL